MLTHETLNNALALVPQPTSRDASADDWARHYAATALAAWHAFHRSPDANLGLLPLLAVHSTSAAVALTDPGDAPGLIHDLTPELGALNGEWEEWIVELLDRLGVNPADISGDYVAGDFRSPSRVAVA